MELRWKLRATARSAPRPPTPIVKAISILNHVLGPIMRGPSSSHTAGAHHIGRMARSLLGATPAKATLAFDPEGSFAVTYAVQGADRGFAMGLMGKPLTEESFFTALDDARQAGLELVFKVRPLAEPDHPNTVEMDLKARDGRPLRLLARSIGGGEVTIIRIDDCPVCFNGSAFETLVECAADKAESAQRLLRLGNETPAVSPHPHTKERAYLTSRQTEALPSAVRERLRALDGSVRIREAEPVYLVQRGRPMFGSASEMARLAESRHCSLGELAVAYEAKLLGLAEKDVIAEALRRYDIMRHSVERGLAPDFTGLQLLPACAGTVFDAEAAGRLSARSLHARAAARALAVMHVDAAMGVVCAAPTGGSAGVIPGALVTLAEERSLTRDQIARALMAAGSIGGIVANRATFAAEVAGCQVEIGASGAMAAAAVVDAVGGAARQACDAAAVAFQNTMGSVCDLIHGMVEIPCHTRNALAAASAFVNADLVLGGYPNFIPLDETIDAVYAVGLAMPSELRCTSKGGLAVTPTALALKPACSSSLCNC